jgi:ankyrin repeat protein
LYGLEIHSPPSFFFSESEKKKSDTDDPLVNISGPPNLLALTSSRLHAVCGPANAFNRNPLHKAVCGMDLPAIKSELSGRPPDFFQRADSMGYCPIHTACSLCLLDPSNSAKVTEIVRLLCSAGAEASVADSNGNTPLHWAARAGDRSTAEYLLLKASPRDAKNDRGETPLHWALRAGRRGMPVAMVLLENGAKPAVWSKEFKRPIEVAADGFQDDENSVIGLKKLVAQRKRLTKDQNQILKEAMEERKEARANILRLSAQSRTLVLHHPECLQHIPKSSGDWENPDRVRSILEKLSGGNIRENEITVSTEFERAKLDLLSRIHSTGYLNFVNKLSKDLERQHRELNVDDEHTDEPDRKPPVVPFTPMVSAPYRTFI